MAEIDREQSLELPSEIDSVQMPTSSRAFLQTEDAGLILESESASQQLRLQTDFSINREERSPTSRPQPQDTQVFQRSPVFLQNKGGDSASSLAIEEPFDTESGLIQDQSVSQFKTEQPEKPQKLKSKQKSQSQMFKPSLKTQITIGTKKVTFNQADLHESDQSAQAAETGFDLWKFVQNRQKEEGLRVISNFRINTLERERRERERLLDKLGNVQYQFLARQESKNFRHEVLGLDDDDEAKSSNSQIQAIDKIETYLQRRSIARVKKMKKDRSALVTLKAGIKNRLIEKLNPDTRAHSDKLKQAKNIFTDPKTRWVTESHFNTMKQHVKRSMSYKEAAAIMQDPEKEPMFQKFSKAQREMLFNLYEEAEHRNDMKDQEDEIDDLFNTQQKAASLSQSVKMDRRKSEFISSYKSMIKRDQVEVHEDAQVLLPEKLDKLIEFYKTKNQLDALLERDFGKWLSKKDKLDLTILYLHGSQGQLSPSKMRKPRLCCGRQAKIWKKWKRSSETFLEKEAQAQFVKVVNEKIDSYSEKLKAQYKSRANANFYKGFQKNDQTELQRHGCGNLFFDILARCFCPLYLQRGQDDEGYDYKVRHLDLKLDRARRAKNNWFRLQVILILGASVSKRTRNVRSMIRQGDVFNDSQESLRMQTKLLNLKKEVKWWERVHQALCCCRRCQKRYQDRQFQSRDSILTLTEKTRKKGEKVPWYDDEDGKHTFAPDSSVTLGLKTYFVCVYYLTYILMPFEAASRYGGYRQELWWGAKLELFIDFSILLRVLTTPFISTIRSKDLSIQSQEKIETRVSQLFSNYFRSTMIIEVLCFLPGLLTLEKPYPLWGSENIVYLFKVIRYLMYLDISSEVTALKDRLCSTYGQKFPKIIELRNFTGVLFRFMMFIHYVACLLSYFSIKDGGYESSWLYQTEEDYNQLLAVAKENYIRAVVITYVNSFYFTTTTVTTVGYGDFLPVNQQQMTWNMVIQFIGLCFFSVIQQNLFQREKRTDIDQIRKKNTQNVIEMLAKIQHVGRRQRDTLSKEDFMELHAAFYDAAERRIMSNYSIREMARDGGFWKTLPPRLKNDICETVYEPLYKKFNYFFHEVQESSSQQLKFPQRNFKRKIISNLQTRILMPNETLIEAGGQVRQVYFIAKGGIRLFTPPVLNEGSRALDGSHKIKDTDIPDSRGVILLRSGSFYGEYQVLNHLNSYWEVKAQFEQHDVKQNRFTVLYTIDANLFRSFQEYFPREMERVQKRAHQRVAYWKRITYEWFSFHSALQQAPANKQMFQENPFDVKEANKTLTTSAKRIKGITTKVNLFDNTSLFKFGQEDMEAMPDTARFHYRVIQWLYDQNFKPDHLNNNFLFKPFLAHVDPDYEFQEMEDAGEYIGDFIHNMEIQVAKRMSSTQVMQQLSMDYVSRYSDRFSRAFDLAKQSYVQINLLFQVAQNTDDTPRLFASMRRFRNFSLIKHRKFRQLIQAKRTWFQQQADEYQEEQEPQYEEKASGKSMSVQEFMKKEFLLYHRNTSLRTVASEMATKGKIVERQSTVTSSRSNGRRQTFMPLVKLDSEVQSDNDALGSEKTQKLEAGEEMPVLLTAPNDAPPFDHLPYSPRESLVTDKKQSLSRSGTSFQSSVLSDSDFQKNEQIEVESIN